MNIKGKTEHVKDQDKKISLQEAALSMQKQKHVHRSLRGILLNI